MLANMRDKKRAKAIIASRAAAVKRKWMAEQRAASRKAEEEEEEKRQAAAAAAGADASPAEAQADDEDDFTPRKRTRLNGASTANRRNSSATRSPSPLPAAAAAASSSSASSASSHVTPPKKLHWKTAAKLAAAEAATASPTATGSVSADSDAADEPSPAAAAASISSSAGASSPAAPASSSAASPAGSSVDTGASPPARSLKSLLSIQRARETRERKAAIAAQRAATRAATMKKKAEAKAAGILLPPVGKSAAGALKSQTAAGSGSSSAATSSTSSSTLSGVSIPTPSWRVVDIHKLAAVLNKFVVGGEVEDMSDKAFSKRHRQLEKDEAQIREEERRDSIVRWAICDAAGCRKWRVLEDDCSIPSDPSVQWYCGALTSRNGRKPLAKHCAPLDDWIIKCVGERLAKELAAAGITTVALFESKDKAALAAYSARMRKLGIYYDAQTQTLCKY